MMDFRVLMMGDCAFTVEFSDLKGPNGSRQVRALRHKVEAAICSGELNGIIDMVSTSRSLTICLLPACENHGHIWNKVSQLVKETTAQHDDTHGSWCLPVCYEGDYAPDLEEVAQRSGLSRDEVIQIHTSGHYSVLMIGFLPGFPFMAEIDERLRFPRRETPRTRVPVGSVAIANDQTAIYPWESPGGWHLLGRCPVPLFDPLWEVPSLLKPGELVTFEQVSAQGYALLEKDLMNGAKHPTSFFMRENAK